MAISEKNRQVPHFINTLYQLYTEKKIAVAANALIDIAGTNNFSRHCYLFPRHC